MNRRDALSSLTLLPMLPLFDSTAARAAVPPGLTFVPPLFVSHGSPMLMLDPGRTGAAWEALARSLPRPRAILAVSAHWMTRRPAVSATPRPETIHDFHGFPDALYDIEYTPPGAVDLAREVADLLPGIGVNPRRGLDHGAWVPLRSMYPAADIPVIQFAVQPQATPEDHFRLGRQLAPLARRGVMIMASGGLTHNLRDLVRDAPDGAAHAYVREFADWFATALARRDLVALLDYRNRAPHAARAHPSEEHLLPIYVALGAAVAAGAGDADFQPFAAYRDYSNGALAMDAFVFAAGTT